MYDAIVLAGGAARRLGGVDKPQLRVDGRSMLDLAVDAVATARRVVVVGPQQPVAHPVSFCREDPPGSGPVAAIAAAVPLTSAQIVVVLAADLPRIAPAVPVLVDAVRGSGVALLVDPGGRANHLAAAWRRVDLVRALAVVGNPVGAAVRSLLAEVEQVHVADEHGWGRDCDTWDDLEQARSARKDN